MSAIKEIRLYNFKAFYGENKIKLSGKNLLLYGENGSGKSSIYWALYTLLQCTTKREEDIEKYFDASKNEHLVNLGYLEPQVTVDPSDGARLYPLPTLLVSYVEVETIDGKVAKIDKDGFTSGDKEYFKGLNRFSDFIAHRLLINFYNFRNSKEINLWEVFVRDIFPFLKTDGGQNDKTLADELKDIVDNQPLIFRDSMFKLSRSQTLQKEFNNRINRFNADVSYWINEINTEVNSFYTTHFEDDNDTKIRISLNYKTPLAFAKVFPQYYKGRERWYNYVGFDKPEIFINVEIKNEDGSFTKVSRPQSFFNEAKLTSIALAVRFTLLLDFIRPSFDGKFLALDDLLVSLDMSNRDKVLDIILDVFAKDYKIYLFTHERSFFNMVKRRLINKNMLEDWNVTEMFMNDFIVPPNPKIVLNQDYLDVALKHLKDFDLPACANYLRKECEFRLKYLLPENLCKKETDSETTYQTLENLIISFLKYFGETLHLDISKYNVLKEKKDLILNPMSHDNLDSEIYKQELVRLYELLLDLRKIEKVLILKCDEQFFFEQVDNTGILRKYKLQAGENLHLYKLQDGNSAHKNIQCKFLECEKEIGTETLNHDAKLKDLQNVAYKHAMQTGGLPSYPDFLEEFKNQDSKTFKQIIIENS